MILHYVGFLVLFISVFVKLDCILPFIQNISSSIFDVNNYEKKKLLVGVLSAQSNFRARKAIRETWGLLSKNSSIEIKFLIGEEICPYPPEDRVTPYDCNLWLINLPQALQEYSTAGGSITTGSCVVGFTFIVKSDIVLRQLGLDYIVFPGNISGKARVVLYNSKTGEKVASATFIKEPFSGFVWKPVLPLFLEKGFEGEIKLIGEALETSFCNHVLQYVAPVYYFETLEPSGIYSEFELGNFKSSVVGMNYSLKGVRGLEELLAERALRFSKWALTMDLIRQQLKDEQKLHNDILFLGGFTDVYDNLSFKLAVFLDWTKKLDEWLYVLKTDDDVFVDLTLVERGLGDGWDVWTCMRAQSPNPGGKWRDRLRREYPIFPSGSGYVLPMDVVKKLHVDPKGRLGEDIMMGFALEGTKSPPEEPCYWACGTMKSHFMPKCNVPELNPVQMRRLWDQYITTSHISTANET